MSGDLQRLGGVAEIRVSNIDKLSIDGQQPVRVCNYVDVYRNDAITAEMPFRDATATPEQVSRFRLSAEDVIITKDSESPDDIGVPAFVPDDLDVVCGYHLALLRPRVGLDGKYLFYALSSQQLQAQLAVAATGITRFGLRQDAIRDLRLPVPSLALQRELSAHLDEQIAEMAAVEAILTRTRVLLDERSAASSRSALLGTHEPGPRRFIDLGWVAGEVPSDWPLVPVGARFEVQLGRMLNQERASGPDMRPYIRNVNVRWDRVDVADLAEMDFPAEDRPRYRLRPGDLLVNEGGAGVGRAAVWDGSVEEIYIQKSVHRVRPRRDDDVRWLAECLRVAVASDIFKASGNAAIPHFPADQFRAWRIPLPPSETQARLLAELAQTRAELTAAAAAVEDQQTLLAERRRVLISEAVAGKLDVGAAA